MADVKQIWILSTLGLVLSLYPSVYCQLAPQLVPQQKMQQHPRACQCPPDWTTRMKPYETLLAQVLQIPNNPLCGFIETKQLLSTCNQAHAGRICAKRSRVDFCCCPVSTSLGLLSYCNTAHTAGSNVCIPSDLSPWLMGLFDAYSTIGYGM